MKREFDWQALAEDLQQRLDERCALDGHEWRDDGDCESCRWCHAIRPKTENRSDPPITLGVEKPTTPPELPLQERGATVTGLRHPLDSSNVVDFAVVAHATGFSA